MFMSDPEQNRKSESAFRWNEASSEAAVLLAEDRPTDAAIAQKGQRWSHHPPWLETAPSVQGESH